MTQLLLETIRAGIFAALIAYLWILARRKGIQRDPEPILILTSLGFILFGLVLDATENIPALSKLVVLGPTRYETLLKNFVGFFPGFLLLSVAITRSMESVSALQEARKALAASQTELEKRVRERTAELAETKERLELAIEGGGLGVWDCSLVTDKLVINPRWAEMLGHTHREIEPHRDSWKSRIHPDDKPTVIQALEDYLKGVTESYGVEHRLESKSGEWRWVFSTGRVVERDDNDKPLRSVGIHQDITDRKLAEAALRENISLLGSTLESTADGILVVDRDGKYAVQNRQFQEMWRIPEQVLSSQDSDEVLDFVMDQLMDPEAFLTKVRELYNQPEAETFDVLEFKDGRVFERYSQPQRMEGKPVGRVWSFRDVTQRKRSEERIRRESEVNAALADLYEPMISQSSKIERIAHVVLEKAKSLTGSEHGYVSEVDPETGDHIGHTLIGMTGDACKVSESRQVLFPKGDDGRYSGLRGHSLNTGEAFFTNSPQYHSASRGIPAGHFPVRQFLAVPVMLENELVGQICLANPPRDYTESDLKAVERLASYYALAVQRNRYDVALREARETLERRVEERTRELRESTEWLERIFVHNPAVVYTARPHGDFGSTFVSPNIRTQLGYEPEDCTGNPSWWADHIHPEDSATVFAGMADLLDSGEVTLEYRFQHKNGTYRWMLDQIRVLSDKEGSASQLMGFWADITERKRAENARRESEERYRRLVDLLPIGVAIHSEGKIVFLNPSAARTLGAREPDELIGKPIGNMVHPDSWKQMTERVRRMIADWRPAPATEIKFRGLDGTVRLGVTHAAPIMHEGKPSVLVAAIDITEVKRLENDLSESEKRFKEFAELLPQFVYEVDAQGKVVFVNESGWKALGYTQVDLEEGVNFLNIVAPEDKDRSAKHFAKMLEGAASHGVEYILVRRDGTTFPALVHSSQIVRDGAVVGVRGIAVDISERKEAEVALELSQQRFRDLAELLPQFVYEVDLTGRFSFLNRAALEMSRYTSEDFERGINALDVFIPEGKEAAAGDIARVLSGEAVGGHEYEVRRKDGTTFPTVSYSCPIVRENKVEGLRGVGVDISERKEAEKRMKADLKEKQLLLREVHHRVKNNLQVIYSLVQLQVMDTSKKSTEEALSELGNRIHAMAQVHEHLHRSPNLAGISVKSYFQSLVNPILNYWALPTTNISLKMDVEEISWNIDTAIPIGLIVNELVINALKHAFPDARAGEISIGLCSIGQEEFELVVADNGIGIPEVVDISASETLGLDLVSLFADQLNAVVELSRKKGTKFRMRFKEVMKPAKGMEGSP